MFDGFGFGGDGPGGGKPLGESKGHGAPGIFAFFERLLGLLAEGFDRCDEHGCSRFEDFGERLAG